MVGAAVVGRLAAIDGRIATVDGEWPPPTVDRRIAAGVGKWRLSTGNEWPPVIGNSRQQFGYLGTYCTIGNVGRGIYRVATFRDGGGIEIL